MTYSLSPEAMHDLLDIEDTRPLAIMRVISGYRNVPALIDNDL
jgi:hypothetical protein